MPSANCVECDANIEIKQDCLVGEIVACADCGAELEVISIEPLQLELAPDVEEDWGE